MAEQNVSGRSITIRDAKIFLRRCVNTGMPVEYFHQRCPCCWDDKLESFASGGVGKITSLVMYRRTYNENIPAPYKVVVVQLSEGPEILGRVAGDVPETASIGDSVVIDVTDDGQLLVRTGA